MIRHNSPANLSPPAASSFLEQHQNDTYTKLMEQLMLHDDRNICNNIAASKENVPTSKLGHVTYIIFSGRHE